MLMFCSGRSLIEYTSGLIETGKSRLPRDTSSNKIHPTFDESVEEHTRLLKISEILFKSLVQISRVQDAAQPTLVHADLNRRNIYVSPEDPTQVTAIIDWQSTSIEPGFIYAFDTPDFASMPSEPAEEEDKDEENGDDTDQEEKAARLRRDKDMTICHTAYDAWMKGKAHNLKAGFRIDHRLTRPFSLCHTSWRDGSAALHRSLIELAAYWEEPNTDLSGACPYAPTEAELAEHVQRWEELEMVQELKSQLADMLVCGSDGWMPNEQWEDALELHRAIYEKWIERAQTDDSMTVERAERLWPFDAR